MDIQSQKTADNEGAAESSAFQDARQALLDMVDSESRLERKAGRRAVLFFLLAMAGYAGLIQLLNATGGVTWSRMFLPVMTVLVPAIAIAWRFLDDAARSRTEKRRLRRIRLALEVMKYSHYTPQFVWARIEREILPAEDTIELDEPIQKILPLHNLAEKAMGLIRSNTST